MPTFIDRCLAGEVTVDQADDFIDAWHKGDDPRGLVEALGMTAAEYECWIFDPDALEAIVAARRAGRAAIIA